MDPVVLARLSEGPVRDWMRSEPILSAILLAAILLPSALGLAWLSWRNRDPDDRSDDNLMRAGISALATLFAFFTAVTTAQFLEQLDQARNAASEEATALAGLREVVGAQQGDLAAIGPAIVADIEAYVEEVTGQEWSDLPETERSEVADEIVGSLAATINSVELGTTDALEAQRYAEVLNALSIFIDARETRLASAETGVPGVLWTFMLVIAVVLLAFVVVWPRSPTLGFKILMVLGLTTAVIGGLYAMVQLESPFSGAVTIDPVLDRLLTPAPR